MSKFLDDFYAFLERVSAPNPSQHDIDVLKAALIENDLEDQEQSEAITALVEKLAASTPAV